MWHQSSLLYCTLSKRCLRYILPSAVNYPMHAVSLKAHLHYLWDLSPSIRVRASMQAKQVNWCFVFTLIRVRVQDFCHWRPCPSSSLHVVISSDVDVQCTCSKPPVHVVATRYCRLPKWPGPQMTSDPSLGYSVNKTLSGTWTRTLAGMLGQPVSCQLTNHIFTADCFQIPSAAFSIQTPLASSDLV